MAVTINNAHVKNLNIGPTIITKGLVGRWDAASARSYPRTGSVWYDLCQHQNGSLVNMSDSNFLEDESGASFVLDGTDEYIAIPSSDALNFGTGSFSVIMWIKISASALPESDGGVYLIGKRGTGSLPGVPGWQIRAKQMSSTAWQIIFVSVEDGTTAATISAGEGISSDLWYMLSLRYNSDLTTLECYVNDDQNAYLNSSATIGSISNSTPLEVFGSSYINGVNAGSAVEALEGSISSLAIHQGVLSLADIIGTYILTKDKHLNT